MIVYFVLLALLLLGALPAWPTSAKWKHMPVGGLGLLVLVILVLLLMGFA